MAEPIISLRDIRKSYKMGDVISQVLQGVSFDIYPGEYVCIMGPSGCGKSTLLNVLGCLDQPTSGDYFLGGENVATLNDDDLSAARNRNLGFIFQSYNLIQQLTVVENISVPMYYGGADDHHMREVAIRLAQQVGLGHRLYHKPNELSGGQQQRVAIARALSNSPLMILADEATGNLDSKSGQEILALFDELNEQGKTLVFVTHDERMVERCSRIIRLRDGVVERDEPGAKAKQKLAQMAVA
ncbi:putative ABC transport system ATP-binding protein [Prosthecobacter debontii]|uniref:Putative ABC transport system ATP-binding protein n=1 Tax=Prosthecobacter debontii TaxID=48467 RepID=A0A1T4XU79_9BACT|nr:ABC transporter ATP-binding protein [Prosthecobacter debontii]SKA92708.1 putative ABC transport system ATP-binding protein [Prosthecobacter debontii]